MPSVRRRPIALAAALAVLAGVGTTGCGESRARRDAREGLTAQLAQAGVAPELAACIVERFFEGRSDAELAGFFERPELTEAEADEVARLTRACLDDS